jgi:DNA-binding FadR family transcriptional regulator
VPVQQARKSTLSGRVIEEFERLIGSGEWALGARIPAEPELMAALDVSRNTVREAVRALVHAGMLDARPGDGTYVVAADELGAAFARRVRRGQALEIIEVRLMIERDAAGLAARRRTEPELRMLQSAYQAQASAFARGDRAACVEAELAFHAAVVDAAHNALLSQLYAQMTAAVRQSIETGVGADMANTEHVTMHDTLMDAIRDQDPERAELAATQHLASAAESLAREEPLTGEELPASKERL